MKYVLFVSKEPDALGLRTTRIVCMRCGSGDETPCFSEELGRDGLPYCALYERKIAEDDGPVNFSSAPIEHDECVEIEIISIQS
ncbi:MAG: hypothetical protein ABH846_04450 [Patescibacteria group bacterium]